MTSPKLNSLLPLLLATGLLCWVAVYNGYPLVYPDTGGYLNWWGTSYRSFFYNLFLAPALLTHTLWPEVVLQSLIVAHLLGLVLRVVFGLDRPLDLLWVVLPLCLLSNAAWFTGFIMPDIFTGVLVLALFLQFFCLPQLGAGEKVWLFVLTVVAIAVHFSHPPVALSLLLAGGLLKLASRRHTFFSPPALKRGTVALAVALVLLLANSYLKYGVLTMSPGGYAFPLARLVADGPAVRYLREHCPGKQYALCDYLDQLPANSDAFLWTSESPFRKVGWIDGYREEGREIVVGTILHYPLQVGKLVLRDTWRQLFMFSNYYGIVSYRDLPHPTKDIKARFPGEFTAYSDSRQNQSTLGLTWFNCLHWSVIKLCLPLGVAVWLAYLRRRRILPVLFLVAFAVAYSLHAFIVAAISGPHNRYGSRLIWLLPFFCLAAIWQMVSAHRRQA